MKERMTIAQLRKQIKRKKRIICFGAGGRLNEVLLQYKNEHIENAIDYIVDNDSKKWNTYKEVNMCKIPIISPEQLKNFYTKKHIIIITLNDRRNDVYLQIHRLLGKKIKCIRTPIIGIENIYITSVCLYLIDQITKIMPIRNYILFKGWGESKRENESTLRDYLIENGYDAKYKIIWRGERKPDKIEKYTYISRHTLDGYCTLKEYWKYLYYLHTAKYIFYEDHIDKSGIRKKQILIYLNHGTPPIKETKKTIILPKITKWCICSSSEIADIVSEQYSISEEKLLICGSPRFDHLYVGERYIDLFIKRINASTKTIMWVPTFRQHNIITSRKDSRIILPFGIPVITQTKDFSDLNDVLAAENTILLIKPHPLQSLDFIKIKNLSHIKLLVQEEMDKYKVGLNLIMKDADAIITDYSTVAFDYMLLDRPIGYTLDDMEDYSIGFSVPNPLDYMPGKKIKNMEDLKVFVKEIANGIDDYRESRNLLKNKIHKYQSRYNCKMLVEKLGL